MEKHILSKSTFIKGMQCHKALYLNKHHKELKAEISAAQEAIFSQGTKNSPVSAPTHVPFYTAHHGLA